MSSDQKVETHDSPPADEHALAGKVNSKHLAPRQGEASIQTFEALLICPDPTIVEKSHAKQIAQRTRARPSKRHNSYLARADSASHRLPIPVHVFGQPIEI